MKMTSHASSISRIDPEAADVLSARCIAATESSGTAACSDPRCSCERGAEHPHHQ